MSNQAKKEIDPRYTWDLSKIYADTAVFEQELIAAQNAVAAFHAHEKTMCEGAQSLLAALRDYFAIDARLEKLWSYASLHFSLDTSNNTYQSMNAKVQKLAVDAESASWFLSPYLLRLSDETVEAWYKECPELENYRRVLYKNLRRKPHMLSDECEEFFSRLEDCFGSQDNVRNVFVNSDLHHGKIIDANGKKVELTDANYITFMMSGERRVRQSAFRALYKSYGNFKNTFATLFDAMVREKVTFARVRGYEDSLTASTFRDEVTPEIYENLIDAVHASLPVLYDYYDLKAEVLGLRRLHMYDLYAPLIGSLDRTYPYEEAVDEVLKTVEVFGEEYTRILREGLTEKRWADVYPAKGKRGGAFSAGTPWTEPYILLNYTETFDDVSTLAHEAGHSMHTYFSVKNNLPHNASYTIFVAELASTVNELLLSHRKLRESENDEEKLYILNHLMETYKGTLFRQTMFAEFERDMHRLSAKGEPLTAELLCDAYGKLVRRYFGAHVTVDKEIALEWARIPHFYRSFYVYKYATCISAASAIVKRIESEGEPFVKKYLEFLGKGDSISPLDSLLVAGIDMRDPSVITDAIADFANAVEEFRTIYRKHAGKELAN